MAIMSLTCLILISALFRSGAGAEVGWWRIVDGGRNWDTEKESFAAVDIDQNMVQLRAFSPGENVTQSGITWVDGIPREGWDIERSVAHIWNNYPLKKTDIPIIDGDPTTSTEGRFKVFGASQRGKRIYLDLGSRTPLNQVKFYPRGVDDPTLVDVSGISLWEYYIRGYELYVNDGLTFGTNGQPIYGDPIKKVEFSRDSVSVVDFELDFVRYIMLRVTATNPFELAEIELYGQGFVPRGEYQSQVIDLGEPSNFGRLTFLAEKLRVIDGELEVEPEAEAGIVVLMRSGIDDSPRVYHQITNVYLNQDSVVTEAEYNSLAKDVQGRIEDDQVNWSRWSSPFHETGQLVDLPSPRQFVQFRITMTSGSILDGIRISDLNLEIANPPLADGLVGEISVVDDPEPEERFPVVPAGETSSFFYDLRADVRFGDNGFDALNIETPTRPEFKQLLMGASEDALSPVEPDRVVAEDTGLTLFFPSDRVTRATSLRVEFETRLLVQSTFFNGRVFDTQSDELAQPVIAANANQQVTTDGLQVLTSSETRRKVLTPVEFSAEVITPNGDGSNDGLIMNFDILQLLEEVPNTVEVFDLSGRRVYAFEETRGRGVYRAIWDGRTNSGQLVPPGIYVVKVAVEINRDDQVQTRTIAVAY